MSSYSLPSNGSECSDRCPGVCYDHICITDPRPPPSQDYLVAAGCLIASAFFIFLTMYILCSHYIQRRGHAALRLSNREGSARLIQINTVGLDETIIDSIAIFEYRDGDGLIDANECSVCLSEFNGGEFLRMLPKCCHAFHVCCIDTWLREHVNCPICRAPIIAPPPAEGLRFSPSPIPPSIISSSSNVVDGGHITGESDYVEIHPPQASTSNVPAMVGNSIESGSSPVRRSASVLVSPVGASSMDAREGLGEERREGGSWKQQNVAKWDTRKRSFFHKYKRSQSLVLPF